MYKLQSSAAAVQTQDKLCEVLLKMLKHNSLLSIKISELCKNANVSRNAFYRNFETTEDILLYHLDKVCIEMSEYLAGSDSHKSTEAYIANFFRFWYAHKDDLELFFQNNISNLLIGRLSEAMELSLAPLAWTTSADNPIKGYVFLSSGLIGVLYTWIRNHYNISPDQLASWMMENLRHGME